MEAVGTEAENLRRLVAEATRAEVDDEAYWEGVSAVQRGDVEQVWQLLQPLVSDPDSRLRAIVPDVLRYLGGKERPLAERSVQLFRQVLEREEASSVISAIGHALYELGHVDRAQLMIPFAGHRNAEVRRAVVAALLAHRDPLAIITLINLSRDEDDDVRDWATFGLGTQVGPLDFDNPNDADVIDTPALRDALAARLDDPHVDTRCEAIVGLAKRRDGRVLPILRAEIEAGAVYSMILEAARWMASTELCEGLRKLAASNDSEDLKFWRENGLDEAMAACCGKTPQ